MDVFILEDDPNRMKIFRRNLIGHPISHADNVHDAKKILSGKKFDYIFLDHDLGGKTYVDSNDPNTGYQLAKWIASKSIPYQRLIVHSLNTVGAQNIQSVIPDAELIPFIRLFP